MVLTIIFTILGSSFAYLSWRTSEIERTEITFTATNGFSCSADGGGDITSGDVTINIDRYEVKKNGTVVDITLREFELLKFLALEPDQIFSREVLLENVWGYEYLGDVRTVDVTIRRLREKIEDDPSLPKYIMTKRSIGYYFNKL